MRRSDFFINQSPSDDEEFPYWTPPDYLEQKFVKINARVREVIKSRVQGNFTRNPALDRKLIEAVEHYGSQPNSLERTQITRSGDVNVFSLLAKRLWRDVARDIATGITPRQCEERYLQLIAAGKWLEQQNAGVKKPPVLHVQPALQPAFVPNKSRSRTSLPSYSVYSATPAPAHAPAHATAHGSVPEKKKHKSNHNSHSIHDLVMMDTWYNAVQHDTYSDSDYGTGGNGSDSDGDVRPYSEQVQHSHTAHTQVRAPTPTPAQTSPRTHTKSNKANPNKANKRRWDQADENLYKKTYLRTYNTTANDTNTNTNAENDDDTRPVRNAASRARNAGCYDTEHVDFMFENDVGFYTTNTDNTSNTTNGIQGSTKRKYTRRDTTNTLDTHTTTVLPKPKQLRHTTSDIDSYGSEHSSDLGSDDSIFDTSSSSEDSSGSDGEEEMGTANVLPVAITNTDTGITDLTTDVADVSTNTAATTTSPFMPVSDATNTAAQCTIIVPNVAPTSPPAPNTVHSHSPNASTAAYVVANTANDAPPDAVDTNAIPLMDAVPSDQYESDNDSLCSVNSVASIQSVRSMKSVVSMASVGSAGSVVSVNSVASVGSINITNWVLPADSDVFEVGSAEPVSSTAMITTHASNSPVPETSYKISVVTTVSDDSCSTSVSVVNANANTNTTTSTTNTNTNTNTNTTPSTNDTAAGTSVVVVDPLDSAEMTRAANILGDYSIPNTTLPFADIANNGNAGDEGDCAVLPTASSHNTSNPTIIITINANTTPSPTPTLTLPPLPPADESLLRSLLPSHHYHKHSINWRFLALVVNKSTAIVRAYARQWRHERRVTMLDKLVLLRERGVKRKCNVRRAKQSGCVARVKPSTPLPYKVLEKSIVYKGTNIYSITNNSTSNTDTTNTTNTNTIPTATSSTKLNSVFSHALLSNFIGSGATETSGCAGGDVVAEPIRAEFHTERSSGVDNSTVAGVGGGVGVGGTSTNVDNQDDSGSESSGGEVHSESEPEAEHVNSNTNTDTNDKVSNAEVGSDSGSMDGDADAMDVVIKLEPDIIHSIVPPGTTVPVVNATDTTTDTTSGTGIISANDTTIGTITQIASDTTTTSIVTSTALTTNHTIPTIPPETATLLATLLDITTTEVEVTEVLSSANSSTMYSDVGGTVTTIDGSVVAANRTSVPLKPTITGSSTDTSIKASSLPVDSIDTTSETHNSDGIINTSTDRTAAGGGTVNVVDKGSVVPPPNDETDGPLVRAAFAYIATHSYLRSLHPDNWRMEGWGTSSSSSGSSGSSGSGGGSSGGSVVMEWTADNVNRFRELLSVHEEFVDKIAATVYPIGTISVAANTVVTTEYGEVTPQNQLLLQAVQKCLNGQLRVKWQYLCSPTYYDPGLLCPVLRNYQWDAVSEAVGWGRAQCQVLYKNILSGGKGNKDTHPVLPPPPQTTAPVAVPVVRPPSPLPKLPTPQWDAVKDKLLLELLQRATLTYPIDLPALALCTKPAERAAQLTQCVPGWVWEGVASSVGMTAKQCMGRYWSLVKHKLFSNLGAPVVLNRNPSAVVEINRINTSSAAARIVKPAATTAAQAEHPTDNVSPPLCYERNGTMFHADEYPWAGTRSVDVFALNEISMINTTSLHYNWSVACVRLKTTQHAFVQASDAVKQNQPLSITDKQRMHRVMEEYFSHPVPGKSRDFSVQNRSEDEWLVRLVWALSNHEPNTSTVLFVFNNPISTVRCILSASQWLTIATALQREIAWCQERYCELMVCIVSSRSPPVASFQLVNTLHTSVVPSVSATRTNNAIVTGTPVIADVLTTLVGTVVSAYEQVALSAAHKVYCGNPDAGIFSQPTAVGKCLYYHNGQLQPQASYPWEGTRAANLILLMQCASINYTNHRQLWTDAVLLLARQMETLQQCVLKQTGILQRLKECSQLFYSAPLPMDFMTFEPQNRSEDDWLVWLVWRSYHSHPVPPPLPLFDIHNLIATTRALLPHVDWVTVGGQLGKSSVWCQNRYFELQRAKFTGTAIVPRSHLLVTSSTAYALNTSRSSTGTTSSATKTGIVLPGGNRNQTSERFVVGVAAAEAARAAKVSVDTITGTNLPNTISVGTTSLPAATGAVATHTTTKVAATATNSGSSLAAYTSTTKPPTVTTNATSTPSAATATVPTTEPQPITYLYRGKPVSQSEYPWSGTHTPISALFDGDVLNSQNDVNRWQQSHARVLHAQSVYQQCVVQRRMSPWIHEWKRKLKECIESFYTQAMPSNTVSFDARSRSEDDWLVRYVWILSQDRAIPSTTNTTSTPSVFNELNLIIHVRAILLFWQWEIVAKALRRSAVYCQDRYLVLMRAKLSNTDPKRLSCLLVAPTDTVGSVSGGTTTTGHDGGGNTTSGSNVVGACDAPNSIGNSGASTAAPAVPTPANNANSTTTSTTTTSRNTTSLAHPSSKSRPAYSIRQVKQAVPAAVKQALIGVIKGVVERAERQIRTDAHLVYINNPTHDLAKISYVSQPKVVGQGPLYLYNKRLLNTTEYPWADYNAANDGLSQENRHIPEYKLYFSMYSTAIVKYAQLLTQYQKANWQVNNSSAGTDAHSKAVSEVLKCKQTFFSNAMPYYYMFMDARNKSEDDWLVWLVSKNTFQVRPKPITTAVHDFLPSVRAILTHVQWESIAELLNRSEVYCLKRYYLLMQAKLTGTDPSPPSHLLVNQKQKGKKITVGAVNTVPNTTTTTNNNNTTTTYSISTTGAANVVKTKHTPSLTTTKATERANLHIHQEVRSIMHTLINTVIDNSGEIETDVVLLEPNTTKTITRKVRDGGMLYPYRGVYLAESEYPWAGTRSVSQELLTQHAGGSAGGNTSNSTNSSSNDSNNGKKNSSSKGYDQEWKTATQRVRTSQHVYRQSLWVMKSGRGLVEEAKMELRQCLESFFSLPIPSEYKRWNMRNRSEDDWLVWLVWTLHHQSHTTTTTTNSVPFDHQNPITAVRRILQVHQWEHISKLLMRTAASCQDRYFVLLQAKLADHDPVPAPYLLVIPSIDGNIGSVGGVGSKGKRRRVGSSVVGVDASSMESGGDGVVEPNVHNDGACGSDIDWDSDSDNSDSDSGGDCDGDGNTSVFHAGTKRKAEHLRTDDAGVNKKVVESGSFGASDTNDGPTEIIELE